MTHSIAIMQPYFLPYIGYWQLLNYVDTFVIYDNIEYTKKGWINRNNFLQNNKSVPFSLPLKKDSDFLTIKERFLSDDFTTSAEKLLRKIHANYQKAPYFNHAFPVIENCLLYNNYNLFHFINHSIKKITNYLNITTNIVISSEIPINHSLKKQEKVIAICQSLNGSTYVNPIGGTSLYQFTSFLEHGIHLIFLKPNDYKYTQYTSPFIPTLSILDIMMFNSIKSISNQLNKFTLINR